MIDILDWDVKLYNRWIVRKNLVRLAGRRDGDMQPRFGFESLGGNAGSWNGYSCMATRFYYDPKHGEIKYFGNMDTVPENIRAKYPDETLRIAVDAKGQLEHNDYHKWGLIIGDTLPHDLPDHARKNIYDAIRLYNERFGFVPKRKNKK